MKLIPVIILSLIGLTSPSSYGQGTGNNSVSALDSPYTKLRGISYFYIDVLTTENRIDDADLRQDIRDTIELELRRSGITPKDLSQVSPNDNNVPLLTVEVRFDRGSIGRYAADVTVSIKDNAVISRNRETVLAETYSQTKKAVGTNDSSLNREIKTRARELVVELIEGIKKNK